MKHLFAPLTRITYLILITGPLLLAQSTASYNGTDVATQGNWTGHYGIDGHILAGGDVVNPSYATVNVSSLSTYTWASASMNNAPRGLQTSSGASTYLASAFVSNDSFVISVTVNDSNSHKIELYLIDWDSNGQRSESISVEDTTGRLLDPSGTPPAGQQFSNFAAGVWASYTFTGNVNIVVASTNQPYLNAAVGGIFFDPVTSTSPAPQTITFNSIPTQTVGGSLPLTATATSGLAVAYSASPSTVCTALGTTASFLAAGSCTITASQAGNSSYAAAPSVPQTFTVNASSSGGTSPPGTYKSDSTTQGNWIGNYGGDGYQTPGTTMLPAYASVSISGAATYSWPAETNNASALETSPGTYLPSMYYATSFSINVGISDNNIHTVALYLLDYDTGNQRREQITIQSNSGAWQNAQTVQNFASGAWAVWTIQGSFSIQVASTNLPYLNAAVSGIFFDTPSSSGPAPQTITFNPIPAQPANTSLTLTATASSGLAVAYSTSTPTVCTVSGTTAVFSAAGGTCTITASQPGNSTYAAAPPTSQNVTVNANSGVGIATATYNPNTDFTTQGNWTNVYGGDGHVIAGGDIAIPSYASVSLYGESTFTWVAASRNNGPRGLQVSSGASSYLAAGYIASKSFTINVDLNDNNSHTVSFYLLDWDTNDQRSESISVEDASTGALLCPSPNTGPTGGPGPQEFSSFQTGIWVSYTIKGNVNFVIASTNSYLNAAVSGIFFSTPGAGAPALPPLNPLSPQVSVFLSSGQWLSENLSGSATASVSGLQGVSDLGDYDGDGLVDAASYLDGMFQITPSSSRSTYSGYFGSPGDIPEPGDYDGDGKTDLAVFRPADGHLYYAPSASPGVPYVAIASQATSSDIPTPGDFDGDGKTDFVYYHPGNATFYEILSTNPGATKPILFGNPGDVPAVGDYDGDGITDIAVYRPTNGYFYYIPSTNPSIFVPQSSQGQSSDIAVPGDYDQDGKTDFALWRPSNQTWYVILSSNPGNTVALPLGATSPVTATPVSLTPFAAYPGVSLSTHKTHITYYTLSGNISSNGVNLPGVSLSATGSSSLQTTSDSNGNYSFTIPANGNIVITPVLAGYIFSPTSFSWTAVADDTVDGNFSYASTAAPPPAAAPVISSLSLTQGPAQMGFQINGSGFGTSQGTSTVAWGTGLMILKWTDTQVTVQIPAGTANQTNTVTVTVANQTSNGMPFTVTGPFGCNN